MTLDLRRLSDKFPPDDIEWRAQQSGQSNGNFWCMVLAYVTNRAIMQRLDDVCGAQNWKNEYKPSPCGNGYICGISIKVNDEWVTKWDGSAIDGSGDIDLVKTCLSNSMKRAAVQWGIGRYLYNLEATFANCSANKVNGWTKARTKDKKYFWWHWNHHMKNQNKSWAVVVPIMDVLTGTLEKT